MNLRFAAVAVLLGSAVPAYAGTSTTVYAQCGAHDGYILLYKSTQNFDELTKLRCGEKLEVVDHAADYLQVSTSAGKTGWLQGSDVTSDAPADATNAEESSAPVTAASNLTAPALTLTNQSVLDLHHAHASSDAIISKIRFSTCSFNTSEYALHVLKAAGVSDKVILEMLETQKPSASSGDVHEVKVVVPGGTPVQVAVTRDVYSDEIHQGAVVEMTVMKDVVVNGVTIIAQGASAHARVIAVKKPGALGAPGEVAWFMQDASAVTGDSVPVAFAPKQPNMIPTGRFQGYSYLMSEYNKRGPAIEPRNRTFIAIVSSDTVMHLPHSVASHSPAPASSKTSAVNLLDR
jgi:hypothetical protein